MLRWWLLHALHITEKLVSNSCLRTEFPIPALGDPTHYHTLSHAVSILISCTSISRLLLCLHQHDTINAAYHNNIRVYQQTTKYLHQLSDGEFTRVA